MVKVASWNVNSIRARLPSFLNWVKSTSPEVILLQEIKCMAEIFPYEEVEDLGYTIKAYGQKSYNGVAILSKLSIEDVEMGLPGDETDEEARYIEAVIDGRLRVASIYVPNGQEVGADKYDYKLRFLERLYNHLKDRLLLEETFIIGGDYNIAPTDADVYDPNIWRDKVLCSKPERAAFRRLLYLGYQDAIRLNYPEETSNNSDLYTWWSYRTKAWTQNKGLRIDHLLLSPQAADLLTATGVDTSPLDHDKASDHAPVWCLIK